MTLNWSFWFGGVSPENISRILNIGKAGRQLLLLDPVFGFLIGRHLCCLLIVLLSVNNALVPLLLAPLAGITSTFPCSLLTGDGMKDLWHESRWHGIVRPHASLDQPSRNVEIALPLKDHCADS